MSTTGNDGRYAPPVAEVQDVRAKGEGEGEGTRVLASRWQRLGAALLDVVAVVVLLLVLDAVTPFSAFLLSSGWVTTVIDVVLGFVLFMLLNGYLLVTAGQTLGKRVLGLRIVRPDGSRVTPARLIGLRYGVFSALHLLPAVGGIANLVNVAFIFRSSRRCLHDDLAGTVVVRV